MSRPKPLMMQQSRFLRWNTSVQSISLVFLVLQSSALTIVMHRSRIVSNDSKPHRYLVSTAMLLAELIKLAVSLTVACYAEFKTAGESQSKPKLHAKGIAHLVCASVHDCVFSSGSWMLILPAGLYALQTHLVYIAVSNMDTVSFQVTYQLKILTTVLFSIIMLQRIITPRQRVALVLLTLGVAFVQVADTGPSSSSLSFPTSLFLVNLGDWLKQMGHQKNISTTTAPANVVAVPTSVFRITGSNMNSSKGFIAAITAAFISGFTGVYFEKLLKESKVSVSLWKRNAQLSCCSIFPIVILGVFWKDGTAIAEHGFFVGYGPIVWATIFLQALGGILVAICITYADNVIKNLAASFSIVVSYLANTVLFDEPMTLNSTFGVSAVLFSLYLYHRSSARPPATPLLPTDKVEPNRWYTEIQGRSSHRKR